MTKRIPPSGWVSMVAEDGNDYTTKSEDNLVAGNKAAVAFSYDPVLPYVDTVTTNTTSAGALQGGDGSGVASLPQRLGVARGPFDAHTRVIVTGRDFLASSNFRLRFNGTDGWSETVTGRVINSTHAVASAPRKLLPEMLPRLTGVTIEPCVLATVEASNDGVWRSSTQKPYGEAPGMTYVTSQEVGVVGISPYTCP